MSREQKTEHPRYKMLLELVSVEGGWLRRFQCPICGKVKLGRIGKTISTKRGEWYCYGDIASNN